MTHREIKCERCDTIVRDPDKINRGISVLCNSCGWVANHHSANKEAVEHPSHYGGDVVHEVIKCLAAWGLERDALLWNVVKYVARAGKKGELLEDLKKARFYLQKRIDRLENEAVK